MVFEGELSEAAVAEMDRDAVWATVQRLQTGLHAREKQLERQGQQLSDMHEVQQQLQVSCYMVYQSLFPQSYKPSSANNSFIMTSKPEVSVAPLLMTQ